MEVETGVADRAEGVGEVANLALGKALGADGAVGDHVFGTGGAADGSLEVVSRYAGLAGVWSGAGGAGGGTEGATAAEVVGARVAGLTGTGEELAVGAGEAEGRGASGAVDEIVGAGNAGQVVVGEVGAGTGSQASVVVEQVRRHALRTHSRRGVAYITVESTRHADLVDRHSHAAHLHALTVLPRIRGSAGHAHALTAAGQARGRTGRTDCGVGVGARRTGRVAHSQVEIVG